VVSERRPSWRGWIHTGVLPIVIAAGVVLVVLANGIPAKAVSSIFFASSILLFGNSALYHRFNWKPRTKKILKRIDHANILLLIAGSYTPITWLALPKDKALLLMIIIWSTAVLGIGFRVFWINAPRWLYVPIYIGMGWVALGFVVDFMNANAPMMILILVGGLLYSLGAAAYAFKWPGCQALRLPRGVPCLHRGRIPLPLDGNSADCARSCQGQLRLLASATSSGY
jgi:hemolysin III